MRRLLRRAALFGCSAHLHFNQSPLNKLEFIKDLQGRGRTVMMVGDGLNDAAVFVFDNPRDSAVTGKIYDVSGAFVSEMSAGPIPNTRTTSGNMMACGIP